MKNFHLYKVYMKIHRWIKISLLKYGIQFLLNFSNQNLSKYHDN